MKETTDYTLKRKTCMFSKDGVRQAASYITLQEPDYTNPENFYKLQDIVTAAQAGMSKLIDESLIEEVLERTPGDVGGTDEKKLHEIDREEGLDDIIHQTLMSLRATEKTPAFVKIFKNMILKSRRRNPCLVDGEESVPMTEAIMSTMHPLDFEGMAAKWVSFFILALEEPEKGSSVKASESATEVKEL